MVAKRLQMKFTFDFLRFINAKFIRRFSLYLNMGLFVILFIILIIGIIYFKGQIVKLDKDIFAIKTGRMAQLKEINRLSAFKNDYTKSLTDFRKMNELLIDRGSVFSFESDVEKTAQSLKISPSLALSDIIVSNGLLPASYEFILSFTATLNDFKLFFIGLNNLPYMLVIDKVEFQSFNQTPLITILGRVFVK